jgi:hypothetical protein
MSPIRSRHHRATDRTYDRRPTNLLVLAVVAMGLVGFGVASVGGMAAFSGAGPAAAVSSGQAGVTIHTVSALSHLSGNPEAATMGPIMAALPTGGAVQPMTATTPGCAGSPCPMGITDYGITRALGTYTESPSVVNSSYDIQTLSVGKASANVCEDSDAVRGECFTLQQNAVTHDTYVKNSNGSYWTQDVAEIAYDKSCSSPCTSRTYSLTWVDNIWNFSSSSGICPSDVAKGAGCINPKNIVGDLGGNCTASGGHPTFYYCVGPITYGLTPGFTVTASMDIDGAGPCKSAATKTCVNFFGEIQNSVGKVLESGYFDGVSFASGSHGAGKPTYYIADAYAPFGLPYDFEWVVAGPGGGLANSVTVVGTMESYICKLGCPAGSQTPIKHAWSSGYDTAEAVSGVVVQATPKVTFEASTSSGTDNSQTSVW